MISKLVAVTWLMAVPKYLSVNNNNNGDKLAFYQLQGKTPAVVFLPGYRSVMEGSKALALEEHCRKTHRAFVRFDYRGHGSLSTGDFLKLTLSDWIDDACIVLDNLTTTGDPPILVGSSMGAWIALLLVQKRPIAGVVGLASAVDFTEDLNLTLKEQEELKETGVLWRPSAYNDGPYPFTQRFLNDAKQWTLLDKDVIQMNNVPLRLIHGQEDKDVPWSKSMDVADKVQHSDVVVSLVKNGDHRLSSPNDLQRMIDAVEDLLRDCH